MNNERPPFIVESIRQNQVARSRAIAERDWQNAFYDWTAFHDRMSRFASSEPVEHAVLSPSGIGGVVNDRKCTRQLVYKNLGDRYGREVIGSRMMGVFDLGDIIEAKVLADIDQTPWKVSLEQMRVDIADGVWGYIDAIVTTPEIPGMDRERYLVDVKSINKFRFTEILGVSNHGQVEDYAARMVKHRDGSFSWSGERTGPKPQESNQVQLNLYLHGLRDRFPDIRGAVIIYYCKDNSALAEFFFRYDEQLALASLSRIEAVRMLSIAATEGAPLPAREFIVGEDWQCDYCQWREVCSEGLPQPEPIQEETLPDEIVEACRQVAEADQFEKELKKKTDGARHRLKALLQDAGIENIDLRKIKRIARKGI